MAVLDVVRLPIFSRSSCNFSCFLQGTSTSPEADRALLSRGSIVVAKFAQDGGDAFRMHNTRDKEGGTATLWFKLGLNSEREVVAVNEFKAREKLTWH